MGSISAASCVPSTHQPVEQQQSTATALMIGSRLARSAQRSVGGLVNSALRSPLSGSCQPASQPAGGYPARRLVGCAEPSAAHLSRPLALVRLAAAHSRAGSVACTRFARSHERACWPLVVLFLLACKLAG